MSTERKGIALSAELADDLNAALRDGAETVGRLMDENARLQRVVDDLATLVRERRKMLILKKDPPGGQRDYLWLNSANEVLERHGLLRDCDRPEKVPSAMRAEVD